MIFMPLLPPAKANIMSTTTPHVVAKDAHPSPVPDSPSSVKKDRLASPSDDGSLEDGSSRSDTLIEEKSRGVVEMEYLADRINTRLLILLYGGFAVLAYTLSLSESHSPSYRQL